MALLPAIQLDDGDLLVLYADGVIEARNPAQRLFGTERLVPLIVGSGTVSWGVWSSTVHFMPAVRSPTQRRQ